MRKYIVGGLLSTLLMMTWSVDLWAQSTARYGLLPTINIGHNTGKGWKINLRTQSRFIIAEGESGAVEGRNLAYNLTDWVAGASYKIDENISIAGAFLLRTRYQEEDNHRLTQQLTIVQRFEGFRLGHRFVTDQTWVPQRDMLLRLRYRLSMEKALSGQEVDPGEMYLKVNNEYLNAFRGGAHDLEIRLIPMIGFLFQDNSKLELGLDYRMNNFIGDAPTGHTLWGAIAWYFKW